MPSRSVSTSRRVRSVSSASAKFPATRASRSSVRAARTCAVGCGMDGQRSTEGSVRLSSASRRHALVHRTRALGGRPSASERRNSYNRGWGAQPVSACVPPYISEPELLDPQATPSRRDRSRPAERRRDPVCRSRLSDSECRFLSPVSMDSEVLSALRRRPASIRLCPDWFLARMWGGWPLKACG